ncbi:alkanesulfonate monooxygenase [Amycolatopsis vancoresmycina DSM 44592]|uniref:Alkanesulfonate monooxygenase n=1 Tax=Amycolatopsis vancoresmycina DSM 44592 TaxID=1292037 RepID=R1I0J6_9PSEU|nr:alkanesulfonate monooxygenase [Amycolatopsis vancoresmycina DSM 44592]
MWADPEFGDLLQYNDEFRTKLIGTPAQIAGGPRPSRWGSEHRRRLA